MAAKRQEDEETLRLRAETTRILNTLQNARDARHQDQLNTGSSNAEAALAAASEAFTLQSGDQWNTSALRARQKRSTLLAADTAPAPSARSSAAVSAVPPVGRR